jgi:hypothetical protein
MNSRERLLTALSNETPDRLPCQVHSWMEFYLKKHLGGRDQYQAYEYFKGMDWVIYEGPRWIFDSKDLERWQVKSTDIGPDSSGNRRVREVITTPGGDLTLARTFTDITVYETEYILKAEHDFELWDKYAPVPARCDWSTVREAKRRTGDRGIVRGGSFGFGQGSPWQDFCMLYGTQEAIMAAMEEPEWVHRVLGSILRKKLRAIEVAGKFELDLVETGGGAGSSTVISPDMHREFCLPYDRQQHAALHAAGTKIVYHLCGGVMPLLDIVAENGADGLETMTPPDMGGDCDLAQAYKQVGDTLFFIGGFDQNKGFEHGTPETAATLVRSCHKACPEGGYICSPSDHFFSGAPENVQAFVDEAGRCRYG